MWAAPTKRREAAKFYCPACLPHELLGVITRDGDKLFGDVC